MINIDIKALSVNRAWQGRRFKTKEYKRYEEELLWLLPKVKIPEGKLKIVIEVGFKNKLSDVDNIAKPLIDILQKKYGFNDREVYKLEMEKKIVKKEYIKFNIGKWKT